MGQQIQLSGSAVPTVRLVEHSKERVVNSAEKLLAQRAVDVREGVEGKHCHVVCVLDGRCFEAGHAVRDDGHSAGIERREDSCGQEGGIDGGGEGEAQVDESAASEVGSNRYSVGVKELVHTVQCEVCWPPVNRRDVRVFKALDELVDGGGRHGWGLTN